LYFKDEVINKIKRIDEMKLCKIKENIKDFGAFQAKRNLQYEITLVSTNKFNNKNINCYKLEMWGDIRVRNLQVVTDLRINNNLLDEQPLFKSYHASFKSAKEGVLKAYEMLDDNLNYHNVYSFRKTLNVKIKTIRKSYNDFTDKFFGKLYFNEVEMLSSRDIIKTYLEANLKGTGYKYTEDVLTSFEKIVRVDIDESEIIFKIINSHNEKELKMNKISLKSLLESKEDLEDLFLACEYIISTIHNSKNNEDIENIEEFTI
jgi:hypothetical protein